MSGAEPALTIAVRGDALHGGLVAILLAQALAPHGCHVAATGLEDDDPPSQSMVIGPSMTQALAASGLTPESFAQAGARQRFHWALREMKIWSAPYGLSHGGIDFHHHLHRAQGELTHEALLPFNPAARLAGRIEDGGFIQKPPFPYGFVLERGKLAPLFESLVKASPVKAALEGAPQLTFTVLGAGAAEWEGSEITLPTSGAFPELGFYRCIKAVDRFLSLLPGKAEPEAQRAEFNRLSQAEDERIADFAAFLVGDRSRPALARKLDVFTACGRIPIEDYEVIPAHYWLGAFLQSDILPRDYDRLADRFPLAETQAWLEDLRKQLDALERSFAA